MMQLLADIIAEVLECFEQESPPTEITIIQFMSAGDWWVHTNTDFYFQVTAVSGGYRTSMHEYFDIEEIATQARLLRTADEINEAARQTAFFYDVMAEAQ